MTEPQRRQDNLVRELENFTPTGDEDIDTSWRASLQKRFVANAAEQRTLTSDLADATRQAEHPTTGDAIVSTSIDIVASTGNSSSRNVPRIA